jgi:hypothetical protein
VYNTSMFDLRLSRRGTSVSARWLLALGVALAGCNADHYYCRVSFAEPGRSGSTSRCAVARTAEEVCRGLDLGTPPPTMPTYRTAGPYANRENCEVAGPLDILRPPADAGRP